MINEDLGLDYSGSGSEMNNDLGLDYGGSSSSSITAVEKYDQSRKLDRAAELKKKELFRKGKLQYEDDGTLIHDSDAMIRAKEAANVGIKGFDWILEATENVMDFGQGDWIEHYTGFKAEHEGKRYSMDNKDFIGARDTTTQKLAEDYRSATHDPSAAKGIYTLRKFDGYNPDGSEKFLYKYGVADVSADTRYRDQYVKDGFEIVEEKRFAGAEDWEAKWNASKEVLEARALDNSFDMVEVDGKMMTRDEASGISFGAGKTELLTRDVLGVDVGKTQADYDANRKFSEELSNRRDAEDWHDNSVFGRGLNTISGAGSMFTKVAIVDTIDWIGEITGIGDLATEEEKMKFTQDLFGYDPHFSKENMSEIKGSIENMMRDGMNWTDLKNVIGSAFANIETTGESLGYLGGLMLGVGKFTKVGQAVTKIEKARKIGTITDAVAKGRTARLMTTASIQEKAAYRLGQQVGLINTTTGMTNDHIDAFKENNNGVGPTGAEVTFMYVNNLVALATDRFTDLSVIKGAGLMSMTKDTIKEIAKDSLPAIANKIVATTGTLVMGMGKEFGQEYYQTMSEQINKQWGTDKYGDSLMPIITSEENILESLVGGAAGAGGAAHFSTAGMAKDFVGQFIKTEDQKDLDAKPATTKTTAEIDKQISETVPNVEPATDGTYDKAAVINEYTELHTKFIVDLREYITKQVASDVNVKNIPLGTSKVFVNRFKASLEKLDGIELTDKEQLALKASWDEIHAFDAELTKVFKEKLKAYSIDEVNAMTHDKLVETFGAQDDQVDDVYEEQDEVVKTEKVDDDVYEEQDPIKATKDDIQSAEVEEVIQKKLGNKRKAKKASRKKIIAKKINKTLESITESDFFASDTGIVSDIKNVMEATVNTADRRKEMAKTLEFTKQYMLDNGHEAGSADKISDEDLGKFLAKGATLWNRAEYYSAVKNAELTSLSDHNRILGKIDTTQEKIINKIDKLIESKTAKRQQYIALGKSINKTLRAKYAEYKKNGIPKEDIETDIGTGLDKDIDDQIEIVKPTHEQIVSQLRKEFKGKSESLQDKKFKVYYSDILNLIENGEKTGMLKLIDTIAHEIDLLESLSEGKQFDISQEVEKEYVEVQEKERKAEEAAAKDIADPSVKLLNRKEIAKARERILELERKLIAVQNDLTDKSNIAKDDKFITNLQASIIDSISGLDQYTRDMYQEYMKLKNALSVYKTEDKKLYRDIKQVDKQIRQLKIDRDNFVKTLNIKQKGTKLTWAEWSDLSTKGIIAKLIRAAHDIKRLFNNAQKEIKTLLAINSKIDSLQAERETLVKDKKGVKENVQKIEKVVKKYGKEIGYKEIDTINAKIDKKTNTAERWKVVYEKVIARLEKSISYPYDSLRILTEQKEATRGLEKTDKYGVSTILSTFTTVGKVASSLLSVLPISSIHNKTLDKYAEKGKEFLIESGIIDAIYDKRTADYIHTYAPFMALMMDKDGNINENVATSIAVAANEIIRNGAGSLYSKTNAEIGRMLGISESAVTKEQREEFRHRTRRSNLANEAGSAIMDMLNLQPKKDGDIEAFERLKASAGITVVKYLLDSGRLVQDSITLSEYNEIMDEPAPTKNKNAYVHFLTRPKNAKGFHTPIPRKLLDAIDVDLKIMEREHLIPRGLSSVLFVKPKAVPKGKRKIADNPLMSPTEEIEDALNLLEAQEHNMLMAGVDKLISMDKDTALRGMGWIPDDEVDTNKWSFDKKETTKAANKEKEREYKELDILKNDLDSGHYDNAMWFKYFTATNNRLNIRSVLIDPQNNKELHRWLITPVKSKRRYTKKGIDKNTPEDIGFKFGIAQAFGHDIDKDTIEDTVANAEKLMAMTDKELDALIEDGQYDHLGHAIQAYMAIEAYQNSKDVINVTITAEYDGITNGTILKALQIPIAENAPGIIFKGGVVAKGIDNSMGQYQRGVGYDEYEGMLKELGESAKERKAIKEMQDAEGYIEKEGDKDINGSVLDVYFTQAIEANLKKDDIIERIAGNDFYGLDDYLMDFIPDVEAGLTKALRELFKFPTMIINYGGALNSIKKSVAQDTTDEMINKLLEDFFPDLESAENVEEEKVLADKKKRAGAVLKIISGKHKISMTQLVHELQTKRLSIIGSKSGRKGYEVFYSVEDNLNKLFLPAVGQAVSDAIEETFGDMIKVTEAVNESSRSMFRVFERVMLKEVKELIAKQGDGTKALSPDEIIELTIKLKKFMPIFDGPATKDRLKDGIAIFDKGLTPNEDLQYGGSLPSVKFIPEGKTEPVTMTARAFVKRISEAYASAGVLPTHTEDAIDMSKTIIGHMMNRGITAVHDAIIIDGKNIGEILSDMNMNIIETSRFYDSINAVAKAMREVYNEATAYGVDLGDMRTGKEIRDIKKRLDEGEEYTPLSYKEQMHLFEDIAEKVWTAKEKLFSHDMKVDQMPGAHSVYERKAEYDASIYVTELSTRIERKREFISEDKLKLVNTEKRMTAFIKRTLSTKGVTGVQNKIMHNVNAIESTLELLIGDKYKKAKEMFVAPEKTFGEKKEKVPAVDTIKKKMKVIAETIKKRKNEHSKTKEYEKAKIANKFIGKGTKNSSTGFYQSLYTENKMANKEDYTADDVVFVSINGGKRKGGIKVVDKNGKLNDKYKLIDKALDSGSTIIMDTKTHANVPWNKGGEGLLMKYMESIAEEKGYVYITVTNPKWTYKNKYGKIVKYGYGKWEKKTASTPLNELLRTSERKHTVKNIDESKPIDMKLDKGTMDALKEYSEIIKNEDC